MFEAIIFIKMFGVVVQCTRELENTKDRYAVAVVHRSTVVGHIPRKIRSCKRPVLSKERNYLL